MNRTLAMVAAALLVAACDSGSDSGTPTNPNPGEPNDTIATATPMTPGTPVVATMGSAVDYDFYAFTVPQGGAFVRFQTFDQSGTTCGTQGTYNIDTYLDVFDVNQTHVGQDDDSAVINGLPTYCEDYTPPNPLPAGTNYVAVSTYPGLPVFVYTLNVTIL